MVETELISLFEVSTHLLGEPDSGVLEAGRKGLMDIRYYHQNFDLELYVGQLESDVVLKEEKNPLFWLPLDEDFADKDKFAGEQNIAHIINVALQYPIPRRSHTQDELYIGVDGCEGLKNQTPHHHTEDALDEPDYFAKASPIRMSHDEVFSGLR